MKEWYDNWIQADTDKGRFFKEISKTPVHAEREVKKIPVFGSCDMSAMVTFVDPGTILESVDVYATVETKGEFTRGMMVVDWQGILEEDKNVIIVTRLDTARARQSFNAVVKGLETSIKLTFKSLFKLFI